MNFNHPIAFWLGCLGITLGVLSHIPMFLHSASMGYQMVGMDMSVTMMAGMAMIPLGLLLSAYGALPKVAVIGQHIDTPLQFHVADSVPLNSEHYKLVAVLMETVASESMMLPYLGFDMARMRTEDSVSRQSAGQLS